MPVSPGHYRAVTVTVWLERNGLFTEAKHTLFLHGRNDDAESPFVSWEEWVCGSEAARCVTDDDGSQLIILQTQQGEQ